MQQLASREEALASSNQLPGEKKFAAHVMEVLRQSQGRLTKHKGVVIWALAYEVIASSDGASDKSSCPTPGSLRCVLLEKPKHQVAKPNVPGVSVEARVPNLPQSGCRNRDGHRKGLDVETG